MTDQAAPAPLTPCNSQPSARPSSQQKAASTQRRKGGGRQRTASVPLRTQSPPLCSSPQLKEECKAGVRETLSAPGFMQQMKGGAKTGCTASQRFYPSLSGLKRVQVCVCLTILFEGAFLLLLRSLSSGSSECMCAPREGSDSGIYSDRMLKVARMVSHSWRLWPFVYPFMW